MGRLFNIARMTTATTGTGTVTLGSAVSGYISFSDAGVQDGHVVTYVLEEGANREIGIGTYTASGTTLSRTTVLNSTAGGTTKITLAGAATVFIDASADDIARPIFLQGHIDGLILANNGTDATNDIDIGAGVTVSDDGVLMQLASGITKRLDASWAVGSGNGGLDTGSIADDWYHMWLIMRPDTQVVDCLFSASATSPTMPANYTKKRRIGAVLRTSSALKAFVQCGDEYLWVTPVSDINVTNAGTSAVTRTLASVPDGLKVLANITCGIINGTSTLIGVIISSLDTTDQAPQSPATNSASSNSFSNYVSGGVVGGWIPEMRIRTNTSAQIRSRQSAGSTNDRLTILTRGWTDPRGRSW